MKTRPHRPTTFTTTLPISGDSGTQTTPIGVAKMSGARAEYDTVKHVRLDRIVAAEDEPDDAGHGSTQSYNDILTDMGYAPDNHYGDTENENTMHRNTHTGRSSRPG